MSLARAKVPLTGLLAISTAIASKTGLRDRLGSHGSIFHTSNCSCVPFCPWHPLSGGRGALGACSSSPRRRSASHLPSEPHPSGPSRRRRTLPQSCSPGPCEHPRRGTGPPVQGRAHDGVLPLFGPPADLVCAQRRGGRRPRWQYPPCRCRCIVPREPTVPGAHGRSRHSSRDIASDCSGPSTGTVWRMPFARVCTPSYIATGRHALVGCGLASRSAVRGHLAALTADGGARANRMAPPGRSHATTLEKWAGEGCAMLRVSDSVPSHPAAGPAKQKMTCFLFSNMPPFPSRERPAACRLPTDMGLPLRHSNR